MSQLQHSIPVHRATGTKACWIKGVRLLAMVFLQGALPRRPSRAQRWVNPPETQNSCFKHRWGPLQLQNWPCRPETNSQNSASANTVLKNEARNCALIKSKKMPTIVNLANLLITMPSFKKWRLLNNLCFHMFSLVSESRWPPEVTKKLDCTYASMLALGRPTPKLSAVNLRLWLVARRNAWSHWIHILHNIRLVHGQ